MKVQTFYPHAQDTNKMPIYIFEQNAFDKMIEVEGEEYRRFRSEDEFGVCSFEAFLKKWEKNYSKHQERRNFKPEFAIDVNGMHSIYGLGGWNRYAVLNSGEITFIEFASISEDIKKAKEVGFRIF